MSTSTPLRVLKPLTVTEAMLTATDVTEADHAAWNAATAYIVGDRVIRTTGVHKIYERLVAGTTATAPESDAANWLEVSATNRWKMFDGRLSTQTTKATSLTLTLVPGTLVNAIALLNIVGASARVKLTHSTDGVVYDVTTDLTAPPSAADGWTYFFEPIRYKTQALALDLPSYYSGITIDITLTAASGSVSLGMLLIGTNNPIGDKGIHYGAGFGLTSYSRKERDQYGDYTIVSRPSAKRSRMELLIPNGQVDFVQTFFSGIADTPVLWVGHQDYEALAVYGFYKDFWAMLSYPNYSQFALEIEGLT